MNTQSTTPVQAQISRVLREYAQVEQTGAAIDPSLSLRDDLAIESLALVSVVLRLEEELGLNIADSGLELHALKTVDDLFGLVRRLNHE